MSDIKVKPSFQPEMPESQSSTPEAAKPGHSSLESKTIEITVKIFDTPAAPKTNKPIEADHLTENHSAEKLNAVGAGNISRMDDHGNVQLGSLILPNDSENLESSIKTLEKAVSAKIDQLGLSKTESAALEKQIIKLIEDAIGRTQDGRIIKLNKETVREDVEIVSYAHLDRETGQLRGTEENLMFFNFQEGETIQVEGEAPVIVSELSILSETEAAIVGDVIKEHLEIIITPRETERKEEAKEEKKHISEGIAYKGSEKVSTEKESEKPGQVIKAKEKLVVTGSMSDSRKAQEKRRKNLEEKIKHLEEKIKKEVKAHELLVKNVNRTELNSSIEDSTNNIEALRAEKVKAEDDLKKL